MPISITSAYHALAPGGLEVSLGASGGSAPYVWSVSGSPGGSIDGSSGIYTSGQSTGIDTIVVTDALNATGSYTMAVNYPILLVTDIIRTAMGLSNGQVYLYNQKINIPIDEKLYIAVGVQSSRPFGNRPRYAGTGSSFSAVQSVNMLVTLSIDILSRSTIALSQKEQVLLALTSPYAQKQMELSSFFVAPITTSFVNLSHIDAAAIPYRFQMLVNLQYFSTLVTSPDYFSSFGSPAITVEE